MRQWRAWPPWLATILACREYVNNSWGVTFLLILLKSEDYWSQSAFVPFLNQLLNELNHRFSAMAKAAARGLHLLEKVKPIWMQESAKTCFGPTIMACLIRTPSSPIELRLWKTKKSNTEGQRVWTHFHTLSRRPWGMLGITNICSRTSHRY